MDIHPDLRQVEFLIGRWVGRGSGFYPTIEPFEYLEEATYQPVPGKPHLEYRQRTRNASTGEPLHAEAGYLRAIGPGRLELVIAQPTGVVEVHTGGLDGTHLHFRAVAVVCSPTAVEVTDVERHLEVLGDELTYRLSLAVPGRGLTPHLEARLHRR